MLGSSQLYIIQDNGRRDEMRLSELKEISSTVILYRLRLLIYRCMHTQYPANSPRAIADNEMLVNDGIKQKDVVRNGALHNDDEPRRERQLDQLDRLDPSHVPTHTVQLERDALSLKAVLDLAFTWKFSIISKASPLNPIIPDKTISCIDASQPYAVLIGIDAYKSYPLRGCVSDALSLRQYLIEDLDVPKERIQCLLGPGNNVQVESLIPSRENIISTLLGLIHNPHIQTGDCIIIYFSGHGTSYACSQCHESVSTGEALETACPKSLCPIEALCPIDRNTLENNRSSVPDISDREINAILTHLYRAKGNRITIILDCCHSANLNRSMPEQGARAIPPLPRASFDQMLFVAEQNMHQFPDHHSILEDDWLPDMDSHVILAACREYQLTNETRGRSGFHGVFTQALLCTLRSGSVARDATYTDLIDALPHSGYQTPVVAGKRKNTRLWYQD